MNIRNVALATNWNQISLSLGTKMNKTQIKIHLNQIRILFFLMTKHITKLLKLQQKWKRYLYFNTQIKANSKYYNSKKNNCDRDTAVK